MMSMEVIDMRNLVEIIAIHFSVRRSRNQKKKFASFLVKEIKKSGHHIKLLRHKSLLSPSLHILSENKKEQKMVVVPYDTGSKMLIPRYKYYLLNATRNFRNEIANTFCTFIYETQHHNGVAELLELLGRYFFFFFFFFFFLIF